MAVTDRQSRNGGPAVRMASASAPLPWRAMSEHTERIADLAQRVDNAKEYL